MNVSTTARAERSSGFTILELMVSAAITSILIVVLITLGSASLDAWGNARAFTRYQSSARSALDLLDSDFRAMVARPRLPGSDAAGAPWLEVVYNDSAGALSSEISFFARATDLDSE